MQWGHSRSPVNSGCLELTGRDCRVCLAGESLRVPALEGQSIYEVALQHDVKVGDVYTCHVILSPDSYAAHDKPLDEVFSCI